MRLPLLREGDARVGFAELFFDLVFVFAITQVSHFLLYHFTTGGAVEAAFMFLAVWWVWIYTTWVLNWLNPDATPVRLLLFAMMIAGLFLSMALPEAFGERAWVFALAYSGMQVGRTFFMYLVVRADPMRRSTYLRILLWFLIAAVFWALGAMDEDRRFALWCVALAVEYAGPVAGYWFPALGRDVTQNWRVAGGHIAERCGLFVIICLGETLLVSGATFAEMEWTTSGTLAFVANVCATVGMWWVYFHIGHKRGTHQIEHSDDPGRIARLSFTYAHIPIVAGVVLSAVGAERAIAHPDDPGHLGDLLALVGGTAVFLGGNGWFKRLSADWFPLSHIAGLGLCLVLGAAGLVMPLWLTSVLLVGLLAVVAIWEDRSLSVQPLKN